METGAVIAVMAEGTVIAVMADMAIAVDTVKDMTIAVDTVKDMTIAVDTVTKSTAETRVVPDNVPVNQDATKITILSTNISLTHLI